MAMFKFVTIIGARPQFIKAAAMSRVFRMNGPEVAREILVHTGQHYDDNMSEIFFRQMEIPAPDHHLEVGSASHGVQTGQMIMKIEKVLQDEKPDMVIVYGDTNSTLAGAVAASKMHIPVAHIEAGLRSFNKSMPEEINRILADHVSTLLFSPTRTGYENLINEGFRENNAPPYSPDNPKIYHCGDVMYDNTMYFGEKAEQFSEILTRLQLEKNHFVLCTIHRDSNTDVPERLNSLFRSLDRLSRDHDMPVVLPLHPRTRKMLDLLLDKSLLRAIHQNHLLKLTDPLSFFDMLLLEKWSKMVITDSGGVQKESYFFKKPCIVLRQESEWKELLDAGTTLLADADEHRILRAFDHFLHYPPTRFPAVFGDGKASEFIFNEMVACLPS